MHTHSNTHTCMIAHTNICTPTQTRTHSWLHTQIYTHPLKHAHMRDCTHKYMHFSTSWYYKFIFFQFPIRIIGRMNNMERLRLVISEMFSPVFCHFFGSIKLFILNDNGRSKWIFVSWTGHSILQCHPWPGSR